MDNIPTPEGIDTTDDVCPGCGELGYDDPADCTICTDEYLSPDDDPRNYHPTVGETVVNTPTPECSESTVRLMDIGEVRPGDILRFSDSDGDDVRASVVVAVIREPGSVLVWSFHHRAVILGVRPPRLTARHYNPQATHYVERVISRDRELQRLFD